MCIITLEHDSQSFKGLAIITLLLAMMNLAHADVYKCTSGKQIVYQPTPCPSSSAVNQNKVAIEKLTPRQLEDIQKQVKATEDEQKAEKIRQEAAAAKWEAEAPLREAEAARRKAAEAKREAAEAKQQAATVVPYPVYIPYPSYGYNYGQRPNYGYQKRYYPSYNPSPYNPSRNNYGIQPVNPLSPNQQLPAFSAPQPMTPPPAYNPADR